MGNSFSGPQVWFGCWQLGDQTSLGLNTNSPYASHWNTQCLSFPTEKWGFEGATDVKCLARHQARDKCSLKVPALMKVTQMTPDMVSATMEARPPGTTLAQMKVSPMAFWGAPSHLDINAFYILVESCPISSSNVILQGDFLSRCLPADFFMSPKPGNTLGSYLPAR